MRRRTLGTTALSGLLVGMIASLPVVGTTGCLGVGDGPVETSSAGLRAVTVPASAAAADLGVVTWLLSDARTGTTADPTRGGTVTGLDDVGRPVLDLQVEVVDGATAIYVDGEPVGADRAEQLAALIQGDLASGAAQRPYADGGCADAWATLADATVQFFAALLVFTLVCVVAPDPEGCEAATNALAEAAQALADAWNALVCCQDGAQAKAADGQMCLNVETKDAA